MKDPTFLFTDIEGATERLRRLGTGYATVLERHRRTIRAVVSASGGHEVDTVGRFSGGRTWLSRCLALDPASSSPAVRATALAGSARLARYQLDMEPARDLARKAVEQANLSSDDRTIGYALYVLGLVEQVDADPRAVGPAPLAAQT